jgi:hypothetical protein
MIACIGTSVNAPYWVAVRDALLGEIDYGLSSAPIVFPEVEYRETASETPSQNPLGDAALDPDGVPVRGPGVMRVLGCLFW